MGSLAVLLALAPFAVGATAGLVRSGPAWRFQIVQLLVLAAFSGGWFMTRVQGTSVDASPAQAFVGWFVVIALPIAVTFIVAKVTRTSPRWVSMALIGPTVFFVTALIAVGLAVSAGLVRF